MVVHVDLVADVLRLEEQMIMKAVMEWARVRLVNLEEEALPLGRINADAAIIRPISMHRALYAASSYEASMVFTVNTSSTILYAGDKMLSYTRLIAHQIPVPKTYYASTPTAAAKAGAELGYPLVIKSPIGSWGRLVVRAKTPEKLAEFSELRRMLPCIQQRTLILQEYLEINNTDIRCVVVDGELVGCVARKARRGEWRSNVALGAATKPYPVDTELEDLAIKAASALKGFFVSVDIFETKSHGYLVNEVNGVPEFKGFMKATGKNPAAELSVKLYHKLHQ
ncbi:MAG: lysine biosynthesis enzyme LysX [Hyperthermus sp.]|nr:MAG: lysine biosynthesis enzyme LysX [Hyperthermus sp.]